MSVVALPVWPAAARPAAKLTVGLLNNMPDSALCATERQFGDLLRAAAGETEIELRCFALPGIIRGERARAQMGERYAPAEALPAAGLDALIVTGNEPRAARLDDEPFWPDLARVIEWTREAATPTLWSCLAAHAAVQRLDGVRRRALPFKLSGVFASTPAEADPLLAGVASPLLTPHSRLNTLAADELLRAGYRILTWSDRAGVDAFAGPGGGLFLQGHPEYDADTLMREYVRDVGRFLRGERPVHPGVPAGYFDAASEMALTDLTTLATAAPHPDLLTLYAEALALALPTRTWKSSAETLYRNWLTSLPVVSTMRNRAAALIIRS